MSKESGYIFSTLVLFALLAACGGGGGGSGGVPSTYTVGGMVTGLAGTGLVLRLNGVDLPIGANGGFSFSGGVSDGTAYNVEVTTSPRLPEQTCGVANGSGTISGANVTNVAITCAFYAARFAYVSNQADNTVSTYAVDAATGRLRVTGYVTAGASPQFVSVSPNGKFAYVANAGSDNVSAYVINPTTGALARIDANPATATIDDFAAGDGPSAVTIDSSGKFAYVSNIGSNNISAYTINATTGALTAVGTVETGTTPIAVSADPSGRFVYVANWNSNTVSAYAIDATSGSLTGVAGSPFPAGVNPTSIAIEPSGRFAYVPNWGSSNVTAYAIESTTGVLTAVSGSPFAGGAAAKSVATDPSGKFAYVANQAGTVSAYTINRTTGALAAVAGSPFAAGTNPLSVSVDPSGTYAYVANGVSNNVGVYSINSATGVLTQFTTLATRGGPDSITLAKFTRPVTVTPKAAYVVNRDSATVSQYTMGGDGALTAMSVPTVNIGADGRGLTVHPTGKSLYVSHGSGEIRAFTVDSTSALSAAGSVSIGLTLGASVTFDSTGNFAYFPILSANTIAAYTVDSPTGALIPNGLPVAAGTTPLGLSIDRSGRFAYAVNIGSDDISAYRVNASTGTLAAIDANPFLPGIQNYSAGANSSGFLLIDPTGRFGYVTDQNANVFAYRIDATSGALVPISGSPFALTLGGSFAPRMFIDPTGRFAYFVRSGANLVSIYSINPASGALTPFSSAGTGVDPGGVAFDPLGRFAFIPYSGCSGLLCGSSPESVRSYSIDQSSGGLITIDADPALPGIQDIDTAPGQGSPTFDASGRFVLVHTSGDDSVRVFALSADSGVLTSVPGSPFATGDGPRAIATVSSYE